MSYTYDWPHPGVTVDIVILTVQGGALKALLVRRAEAPYRGEWALPGGFVGPDESLKRAAWRELKEETGVHAVYLEQLYTFGHPQRDPRERVISVAYFALIPTDKLVLQSGSDASEVAWHSIDAVPELAFDHGKILNKALARLAAKLSYSTIGLQLMPETFTLRELQRVYELVAQQSIDKRNFQKRLFALNIVVPTGEQRREGSHRPARLYRARDPKRVDLIK